MKRTAIFYLKQTIMLGTAGFILWLLYCWWRIGFFWAADTLEAWLFTLLLVAAFLFLVCTPVQLLCNKFKKPYYAYLLGLFSGPLAVVIFLTLFTHAPVDFTYYIARQWLMHIIFGLLGLWFAVNYRQHRHNKRVNQTAGSPAA